MKTASQMCVQAHICESERERERESERLYILSLEQI